MSVRIKCFLLVAPLVGWLAGGAAIADDRPPVIVGSGRASPSRPVASPSSKSGPNSRAIPTASSVPQSGHPDSKAGRSVGISAPVRSGVKSAPRLGGGVPTSASGDQAVGGFLPTRSGTSVPPHTDIIDGWGTADSALDLNGDGTVNGIDLALSLAASLQSGSDSANGADGGSAPTLVAGTGFAGDTEEPSPRGEVDDVGYGSRAIARWNSVPNQVQKERFTVGVVAFHAFGVARVDFSLNGGPWISVDAPTMNPESQTVEYWAYVDPSAMTAGGAEVRAVVYPNVGHCRVLGGSMLDDDRDEGEYGHFFTAIPSDSFMDFACYVAPGGSDSSGDGSRDLPFASIMRAAKRLEELGGGDAGGGAIRLLPGDYVYGGYTFALRTNVERGWVTIEPAEGVAAESVRIVGGESGGTRMALVRFHDMTIQPLGGTNTVLLTNSGSVRRLWLDGCRLLGVGPFTTGNWQNGFNEVYATDTFLTDSRHGLWGAELQRGVSLGWIGSDAFTNGKLIVNCSVEKIDSGPTDFHPDFFMIYDTPGIPIENIIMYGCLGGAHMDTQGPFSKLNPLSDIALVNVQFDNRPMNTVFKAFQFGGPIQHMVIQDCSLLGPAIWRIEDPGFELRDVVIRSTEWSGSGIWPGQLAGLTYEE